MDFKKRTIADIRKVVDEEGLGDTIMYRFVVSDIEDDVLAGMWKKAADILWDIDTYLGTAK